MSEPDQELRRLMAEVMREVDVDPEQGAGLALLRLRQGRPEDAAASRALDDEAQAVLLPLVQEAVADLGRGRPDREYLEWVLARLRSAP